MSYIRNLILENAFLKFASLFFAIVLWFYISPISMRDTLEVNYVLPLELKNIPEDMMVIGNFEDRINVRLRGRQNVLRDLDPTQLSVSLDLSKVKAGGRFYAIDNSNINIPHGTNMEVIRIDPKKIKIDVVNSVKKDVKVQINITGMPEPGYKLRRISINPPLVTVEGSEYEVTSLSVLKGPEIDITGRKNSFTREVKIDTPFHNVRVLGKRVITVYVEISKI
ncbi:MAG: hypothetical protein IT392_04560 [Nitrospirae bacterium]|nr:hypothetical protein [Nitrospirota bacterium]